MKVAYLDLLALLYFIELSLPSLQKQLMANLVFF